jgi:hypothetical protein
MTEGIDETLESLVEALAAVEHQQWSHWQRYVHDRGKVQPDGALLLPPELVSRWERQISTSYEDLSEDEKESDREQVRRYLPIIAPALRIRNRKFLE